MADASGRLMRTAYLLSGDRGHAEDLVQSTLLRTARRWPHARRHPEAYARRVLVNLAKDRWRMLRRRVAEVAVAAEEPWPGAATEDDSVLERERLLAAIRELPAGQRAVLVLRFFDDLSVVEVAARSGLLPRAPSSHRPPRALDRMRTVLDRAHPGEDERRC